VRLADAEIVIKISIKASLAEQETITTFTIEIEPESAIKKTLKAPKAKISFLVFYANLRKIFRSYRRCRTFHGTSFFICFPALISSREEEEEVKGKPGKVCFSCPKKRFPCCTCEDASCF